jgi:hypothetical protein
VEEQFLLARDIRHAIEGNYIALRHILDYALSSQYSARYSESFRPLIPVFYYSRVYVVFRGAKTQV